MSNQATVAISSSKDAYDSNRDSPVNGMPSGPQSPRIFTPDSLRYNEPHAIDVEPALAHDARFKEDLTKLSMVFKTKLAELRTAQFPLHALDLFASWLYGWAV